MTTSTKTTTDQPAEQKAPETKGESKAPRTIQSMTIGQFLGNVVERIVLDRTQVQQVRRDIGVWYAANLPVGKEKEFAIQTRKDIETAKLAMDAMFEQFLSAARNEF